MATLAELGADIEWTDAAAARALRSAARPGTGRLVELAAWLASTKGHSPPRRARCVAFGELPRHVTALAAMLDVGARAVPAEDVTVADAVAAGASAADREVDAGADLIVVAAPDASAAPAVAVGVLTNAEPVAMLPRGAAAVDTAAWIARAEHLRDTRRAVAGLRSDPDALLAATGDLVLASVTGFVLRAVARRTPLLLDGPAAAAAALLACRVQSRAGRWVRFADRSPDPVHVRALRDLDSEPVLDLGTTSGDGTAGLLALMVVRAAMVATSDD